MTDKPSICFFHTGRALPHILLGEGPEQAGGAEVRASILARALARRGWPLTFIICDYGQPDELVTDDGIRLLKAGAPRGGLPVLRFFTHTLPADIRAVRRADAAVYVGFGANWHAGALARECHRSGRRFLLWIASSSDPHVRRKDISLASPHERWLAQQGLKRADVVIAQTDEQRDAMRELYGRDCPVIPNVWDVTPCAGEKADPPEVFWAARYLPLKRPEMVLEIARRLPEIKFVMAGGPVSGHEDLYERVQREAALLPNVETLGFVPFAEIDRYYARASVYLCTSTIEGFPNTFLQAWNHKTPVVSTYNPDGMLSSGDVGVAGDDIETLVDGVARLCGEEGRQMGVRARQHLERVHSVEAVLPKLEAVLMGEGSWTQSGDRCPTAPDTTQSSSEGRR